MPQSRFARVMETLVRALVKAFRVAVEDALDEREHAGDVLRARGA